MAKITRRDFLRGSIATMVACAIGRYLTACGAMTKPQAQNQSPQPAQVLPPSPPSKPVQTSTPASSNLTEPFPARYWKEIGGNKVQCELCFRKCLITEGGRGYCEARINQRGKLYSLTYGKAAAAQIQPVEKEPMLHFLPGASALSLGTPSCNFQCNFCHNYAIAINKPEKVVTFSMSPEEAIRKAKEIQTECIAFTFNEPTVCYEWMSDIARLAKREGLRTYFHTNGGINPEPLKEVIKNMDAVCVDLKAFTAEFYKSTSNSDIEPVLTCLKTLKQEGIWFEIAYLVIPTLNDDGSQLDTMCRWIKSNLGDEIPLHFTRFLPSYKLIKLPPTPVDTLEKAHQIAQKAGLKYVTIGNIPGHIYNSTYCPKCGKLLIKRIEFAMVESHVKKGKCEYCGYSIKGIW